jgi:hypothetical protein
MNGNAAVFRNWAFSLVLIWLTGCSFTGPGPRTLKNNWDDYDGAYGDANNRQLLLNLARLANDDPVNFLQLGTFSAQYTYNAQMGFNPGNVHTQPGNYVASQTVAAGGTPASGGNTLTTTVGEFAKNVTTLNGSLMGTVGESPNFQFLPLTGSNIVSATLTPIDPKIFYTFYDQGYPADLLARTMIASVRCMIFHTNYIDRKTIYSENITARPIPHYQAIVNPDGSNPTVKTTFTAVLETNQGPPKYTVPQVTTNYEYLVNSPFDRSYPDFLNFCSALYRAQIAHVITVDTGAEGSTLIYSGPKEKMTDIVSAVQANLSVKYTNGEYQITQPSQTKSFKVEVDDFFYKMRVSSLGGHPGLNDAVPNPEVNYYTVDNEPAPPESANVLNLAEGFKAGRFEFKMRTVEAAMYTAAQENTCYRRLTDNGQTNDSPYSLAFHKNAADMQFLVTVQQQINTEQTQLKTLLHQVSDVLNLKTENAVIDLSHQPSADDVAAGVMDLHNAVQRLEDQKGVLTINKNQTMPLLDSLKDIQMALDPLNVKQEFSNPAGVDQNALPRGQLKAFVADSHRALVLLADASDSLNEYLRCTISFGSDHLGPYAIVNRPDGSKFQARPLMKLTREDGEEAPYNPTAEIPYGGDLRKLYFVADPMSGPNRWHITQNRTVFTMLTYLFAQTAVSTQNLPVQQLIQVQ